jgi:hypothetical protein
LIFRSNVIPEKGIEMNKNIGDSFRTLLENWDKIFLVFHAVSAFMGKEGKDDLPPELKMASGFFASGDEKKFVRMILEFSDEDQKILLGLFEHVFGSANSPRSWIKSLIVFVQSNRFRILVTDLDVQPREAGTEKVVRTIRAQTGAPNSGNSETTTTERKLFAGASDITKKLFEQLVKIVKDKEVSGGTREEGYEAATSYMRRLGLPLMPTRDVDEWINKNIPDVFGPTKEMLADIDRWFVNQAKEIDRREAAKPWWLRMLRKIIG